MKIKTIITAFLNFFIKITFACGAVPKLQMYDNFVYFIWYFLAAKISWNILNIVLEDPLMKNSYYPMYFNTQRISATVHSLLENNLNS